MKPFASAAALGAMIAIACVAASPAWGANASQEVQGGSLGLTVYDVALPGRQLTGTNQTVVGTSETEWIAKDARGQGSGWSVTIAADGNLTSPGGTVESAARTLAISNLHFDPGTVSAKPGSDSTANLTATALTLSTTTQTFLACASLCKGKYGFTPTLTLSIPANAFRSNYAGIVGASSYIPYSVTVTFTIS